MMSDKEFEEMREWGIKKMEEMKQHLKKMSEEYKGMPKDKLHQRMNMQDTETLKWICSDIALPTEHYELCQIAKEILNERGESL